MEVGIANLYVSWNLARICRYWMIVKLNGYKGFNYTLKFILAIKG